MEDVAVYGYITPLKVKIVIALPLSDMVVRDTDVVTVGGTISSVLPLLTRHADFQGASHGILFVNREPFPQIKLFRGGQQRASSTFSCRES